MEGLVELAYFWPGQADLTHDHPLHILISDIDTAQEFCLQCSKLGCCLIAADSKAGLSGSCVRNIHTQVQSASIIGLQPTQEQNVSVCYEWSFLRQFGLQTLVSATVMS